MVDVGDYSDDIVEQINWNDLDCIFQNIPEHPIDDLFTSHDSPIQQIEQFLMKDDHDVVLGEETDHQFAADFLSDILVDSPIPSGEVIDDPKVSSGSEVEEQDDDKDSDKVSQEEEKDAVDELSDDDPNNKKRKRQLRNRDAAVRSRERKKLYVKDLELKSRYYESECKRLGLMLQCCLSENQALRLSLQNSSAIGASMAKQESAVLFLESLLLGSLLWFLGIMCLLILPTHPWSNPEEVPLENLGNKNQGHLVPRKEGKKTSRILVFQSFMMGKRCKASRSRMKFNSCSLGIVA